MRIVQAVYFVCLPLFFVTMGIIVLPCQKTYPQTCAPAKIQLSQRSLNAQAEMSFRWAHMSECTFFLVAAPDGNKACALSGSLLLGYSL